MGVEAGDIIVSEVSLDPEHLEMIDLRFDMPITVEAFIQCAPTLDALVTQEYLTLDELNTLRSQAVEGHVEPGTTRYFFVPAPMDPVEELSVASLRLG